MVPCLSDNGYKKKRKILRDAEERSARSFMMFPQLAELHLRYWRFQERKKRKKYDEGKSRILGSERESHTK